MTTRTKNKKGNLSYCTLNYKAEITEWCTILPLIWTTTDVYDLALIPTIITEELTKKLYRMGILCI